MEIPYDRTIIYRITLALNGFTDPWIGTLERGAEKIVGEPVSVEERGHGYYSLVISTENPDLIVSAETYLRRIYPLALQSCQAAADRKREKRRQLDLFR